MFRSAGALIAFAALLAGCGAEPSSAGNFEGEQRAVAEAIEEIQAAGERRDAEKLCRDLLAKALRDEIAGAGASCDDEMEKAIEDADAFEIEVREVTVSGSTAQAEVRGKASDVRTFRMVKEDGRWRAAAF